MAFTLPYFYDYPPYFTYAESPSNLLVSRVHEPYLRLKFWKGTTCRLQPVQETRKKQSNLWQQLILTYCHHYKVLRKCVVIRHSTTFEVRRQIEINALDVDFQSF